MDETDKTLEEVFQKRNETLSGLYDSETQELSEAEVSSLTPILNSLQVDIKQRYREIEPLGKGGEKRVTLVHDHRLDRRVAMAHAAKADAPQDHEGFLREARLTANLSHPNIMPIYNMGLDENGEPFFSMELVPGDSLKSIIKKLNAKDEAYRKEYPRKALLNIFMKVCDAVAYAHSRRVLHLDIKPDNIKVGAFGKVFVCDWGLARVINSLDEDIDEGSAELDGDMLNDMTLSGTIKGTPGFMAPEQTVGYGEKTPETDIYALGALLYMILTHKLPVDGQSANEVMLNTREGRVILPRRRQTDTPVPKGLVAVVMKALALDPNDRYSSVLELQDEISLFLSGHSTHAENAGWITQISLLLQRHSRLAFLLIFFLLLLAAVIGANLVAISREKAEAVVARVEAVAAREEAVKAREEAEWNLNLYYEQQQFAEEQQQLAKERGADLGEAVLYTAQSTDFINAPSMIQVLSAGLKEKRPEAEVQNLLAQKGTLHFVMQEFNAANACFAGAGTSKRMRNLKPLCLKYGKIKAVDKQRLTDQQLADLFDEASNVDRSTLYYLYYHHMRRRPAAATPEQYLPLAEAVLIKLNDANPQQVKPLKLTKLKNSGYHLSMKGSTYKSLFISIQGVYRRNVLDPLQLSAIDISHSKLTNLKNLQGLKLEELKMGSVHVTGKKWLAQQLESFKLKRIILNIDDYPAETIAELRKTMLVVDSKD